MNSLLNSNKLAVMVVYENKNEYGKSDIVVKDGYVVKYNKRVQSEDMTWINFGVIALKKNALEFIPEGRECSEEVFYCELIKRRELLAFSASNRFYEIGNPNSLREFEEFISTEELHS
jgi:NDP-sugar pyrophosphorylase family protein